MWTSRCKTSGNKIFYLHVGQACWGWRHAKVCNHSHVHPKPRLAQSQPGHDVTPFPWRRQTGQVRPGFAAFRLVVIPGDFCITYNEKVAMTCEADTSVFALGVRTQGFILSTCTFLAEVATKMTLKTRPIWHWAVPSVLTCKTFRECWKSAKQEGWLFSIAVDNCNDMR